MKAKDPTSTSTWTWPVAKVEQIWSGETRERDRQLRFQVDELSHKSVDDHRWERGMVPTVRLESNSFESRDGGSRIETTARGDQPTGLAGSPFKGQRPELRAYSLTCCSEIPGQVCHESLQRRRRRARHLLGSCQGSAVKTGQAPAPRPVNRASRKGRHKHKQRNT